LGRSADGTLESPKIEAGPIKLNPLRRRTLLSGRPASHVRRLGAAAGAAACQP